MEPEAAGKRCWLEFEGIAGCCEIWVNGKFLAKHMNPYTGLIVEATELVRPGGNLIQVHVDSRMKPNSRWYVGTGLYRRVWLHLAEPVSAAPEGLRVATKAVEGEAAVIELSAALTGPADTVRFAVTAPDGSRIAEAPAAVADGTARAELRLSGITPWSPETPVLCRVEAQVRTGDTRDTASVRTGFRVISVDAKEGMKLNGRPVKLRGGCVHHDLGMLVIEEAFDEWVMGRTDFGLHITFEDRWERDLEDMVRGLDSTRPVSASACSLFIEYTQQPGPGAEGTTGSQALNMAYDAFAEGRGLWGPATAEYFAPLDVAGYNYKAARYEYDGETFPDRVICGSESCPRAALQSWQAAARSPHVIGDFVWVAWDYLGEVGIGRWEVSGQPRPGEAGYPWLLSYCGGFDITGQKRPQSYYRDVVWGRAEAPKIFCLPPELTGRSIARLSWGWLPVRRSYTFDGHEERTLEVHVYAGADQVERFQNGVSQGTLPCGKAQEYQAVFTVPYRPGRLDVPLGELMKGAGAAEVLKQYLGETAPCSPPRGA